MNKHNKTIKISIPRDLYIKINEIFKEENVKTVNKIFFLIYLINKGQYDKNTKSHLNYYLISIHHLREWLVLNKKLSKILKTLQENNIIIKGEGSNIGTKYLMFNRFDFNNKNNVVFFLHTEDGTYVTKYINDGYIVKFSNKGLNKIDSSIPLKNTDKIYSNDNSDVLLLREENNRLKKEIEELKKIIKENDILIPSNEPKDCFEKSSDMLNKKEMEETDLSRFYKTKDGAKDTHETIEEENVKQFIKKHFSNNDSSSLFQIDKTSSNVVEPILVKHPFDTYINYFLDNEIDDYNLFKELVYNKIISKTKKDNKEKILEVLNKRLLARKITKENYEDNFNEIIKV